MLTIATWNVENLFRPGTGGTRLTPDAYDRKLAYLAETLRAAMVDAVALQEVGGDDELTDLAAAAGLTHTAAGQPDARGIRVAVLSRYPITAAVDTVDFPDGALRDVPDPNGRLLNSMSRGLLTTTLDVSGASTAGDAIRVATCHLKSKLLTFPDGRRFPVDEDERARGAGYALMKRSAEAAAVRVHLNAAMVGDPVGAEVPTILAGDMNDEALAVTTAMLAGPEDGDPRRPDKGDPVRLYNLADRIPADRRFSRIYRGRRELIDHVLVSRPLLLAGVHADALVDDIPGITESIQERADAVVPDHACVVAQLSW
jgi:endonuclease/exonuclease/phosphatase family metal-dependent hydrolase